MNHSLDAADEEVAAEQQDGDQILSCRFKRLETLFDYIPDLVLVVDHDVADAVTTRGGGLRTRKELDGGRPLQPDRVYLRREEWDGEADKTLVAKVTPSSELSGPPLILSRLPAAVDEAPSLRRVLMKDIMALLNQISQWTSCNRLHEVQERCARWLLRTHDRVEGDTFPLT